MVSSRLRCRSAFGLIVVVGTTWRRRRRRPLSGLDAPNASRLWPNPVTMSRILVNCSPRAAACHGSPADARGSAPLQRFQLGKQIGRQDQFQLAKDGLALARFFLVER